MKKIIPCFYASYGRYISQFRAIPNYIDGLKPVERRILYASYKVARDKYQKSAKVVGYTMGELHPHGDLSIYNTLQNLVHNGYMDKKGSWGAPSMSPENDMKAAAMRYTECKLSKWVINLAFEYLKYTPFHNPEYQDEPIALPSPIPLGLIGSNVSTGIAFHRTLMPKYNLSCLAKRLKWILDKKVGDEPIIIPNIENCDVRESEPDAFRKLLTTGIGKLQIVPYGNVSKNQIQILGRCPTKTFNSLVKEFDSKSKSKQKIIPVRLVDSSKKTIDVRIIPENKKVNLQNLVAEIWPKYLVHNLNFSVLNVDEEGIIHEVGIDDMLSMSYTFWRSIVLEKRINDANKTYKTLLDTHILDIIGKAIKNHNCTNLSDILTYIHKNHGNYIVKLESYDRQTQAWTPYDYNVKDEDIEVLYKSKPIQKLVEFKSDMQKINQSIIDAKNSIANLDNDCYNRVVSLI